MANFKELIWERNQEFNSRITNIFALKVCKIAIFCRIGGNQA
jgi:hypothetical protein